MALAHTDTHSHTLAHFLRVGVCHVELLLVFVHWSPLKVALPSSVPQLNCKTNKAKRFSLIQLAWLPAC